VAHGETWLPADIAAATGLTEPLTDVFADRIA
jgi:hypothetical protein